MQTFLPYPDFACSARVLDRQRLGKQRVECLQILNVLARSNAHVMGTPVIAWANHPAVRMWRGFEIDLRQYQRACILEWIARGYNNTMAYELECCDSHLQPPWLGDEAFHASHRAALLHKAPEHYGQFGWAEEAKLDYVWPV